MIRGSLNISLSNAGVKRGSDISCNINEPEKTSTWKKAGVKLYKLHADNSGSHTDL